MAMLEMEFKGISISFPLSLRPCLGCLRSLSSLTPLGGGIPCLCQGPQSCVSQQEPPVWRGWAVSAWISGGPRLCALTADLESILPDVPLF